MKKDFCRGKDKNDFCITFGIGPVRDKMVCSICKKRGGYLENKINYRQCTYQEITKEKVKREDCDCKTFIVNCRHPKLMIKGKPHKTTTRTCNILECKFFTLEGVGYESNGNS